MKHIYLFVLGVNCIYGQQRISSPDRNIVLELTVAPLEYSVSYGGKSIMANSKLQSEIEGRGLVQNATLMESPAFSKKEQQYDLPAGKASKVKAVCSHGIFRLNYGKQKESRPDLEVCVFDEGVAFRYVFPKSGNAFYAV